jgi:hypothetical protein
VKREVKEHPPYPLIFWIGQSFICPIQKKKRTTGVLTLHCSLLTIQFIRRGKKMAQDKTKQKSSDAEKSKPGKHPKKKELVPLDENMLMLAREVFKHISPLNLEINEHQNRKTIIISETELNSFLEVNIKLAQINDVKRMHLNILDNDVLEMDMQIFSYSSFSDLKKQIKIQNGFFNEEDGYIELKVLDDSVSKGGYAANRIMLLITKYILKTLLLPEILKHLKEDSIHQEKEMIKIDLKNGSFQALYNKTINQLLNTSVPYFGTKHLMELIELESLMCEKGQLWIDFIYKIV